jgi:hypothetical protein
MGAHIDKAAKRVKNPPATAPGHTAPLALLNVAVSPNVHVLLDHVLTQFRGLLQELRNTQLFVCLRNRWKLRSGPATNDQDKHRWTKCFTLVNDGPHRCSS